MVKRRKNERSGKRSRVIIYSFLVTISVLTLSTYVLLNLNPGPSVEQLPTSARFLRQGWMSYVPANADFISVVNLARVLDAYPYLSGVLNGTVLDLVRQRILISARNISLLATASVPSSPDQSATINIILPTQQTYSILQSIINKTSPAPTVRNNHLIYQVVNRLTTGTQQLKVGYLTLDNGSIIYSEDGIKWVENSLDLADTGSPDLFDDVGLRTSFVVSNSPGALGLFVAKFATNVMASKSTVKTISGSGGMLTVRTVLMFDNVDVALANYDAVKRAYPGAESYRVLQSFVLLVKSAPASSLPSELRGL